MSETLALPYAALMYARDHALIATPIGLGRFEDDADILFHIHLGAKAPAQNGEAAMVRDVTLQIDSRFCFNLKYFDSALPRIVSPRDQGTGFPSDGR